MNETQKHLETLTEIRSLMERSSRFLSLSGLSGIWAGSCALAGAAVIYFYLDLVPFDSNSEQYYLRLFTTKKWGLDSETVLLLTAFSVMAVALAGGIYFTTRKAKKQGLKVWDASIRRLLVALAIPLVTGGIFCLKLLYSGLTGFVPPATLIFYGLALVNGSKYTVGDVFWLGIAQIALGLFGSFFVDHGLELWVIGFGFLHIIYGIIMYRKNG